MKFKVIATSALVASMSLAPIGPMATPAHADGKDVVAGLIIGGIIGGIIANENKKKKSVKSTKAKGPSMSAEQREANREVQTSLNYFGYNVGTPDGSIGPKSRAAIKNYQAFLGYPATGELSERERTILVTSYHRAVAGGPVIAGVVSGSVLGLNAVLIAQRDEMAGIAPVVVAAAPAVAPPGSVAAKAAAAIPTLLPQEPVLEVLVVAEPVLPSFMNPSGAKGSLAAECNQISLTTNTNGGFTTAEGMLDANFALAEQFCLARTYAMANSEDLAQKVAGFTPDQIAGQCAAFGPVLKDHVAALSMKPAGDVLTGVQGFIATSGMTPVQLSGTAKVCLGVGYTRDAMDVAIGSALLLTAMGETGYAEFLGHHLSQGFGATERPDLAMGWYDISLDAMGQGGTIVAPGMEGRDTLIRKASYTINGRAAELTPEAVIQEAALPVLVIAPEMVAEEPAIKVVAAPVMKPKVPKVAVVASGGEAAVVAEPAPVAEALAVAEPETLAPVEAPALLGTAVAAPVFVAPKIADLALGTPAPKPAALAVAEVMPEMVPEMALAEGDDADAGLVNAGAQAALMAARLPFLIFSSF